MNGQRRFWISLAAVLLLVNLVMIAYRASLGDMAGMLMFAVSGAIAAFLIALWIYVDDERRGNDAPPSSFTSITTPRRSKHHD
jgi:hypothetical protein